MTGSLTPFSLTESVGDLLDFVRSDHIRFPLGWSVDDRVGYVGVGEMALMWARTSSGKSTWTLNVIRNTPEIPTLVVNMEMTPRRQVDWLLPMTYDLDTEAKNVEEVLRFGEDDPRYEELVEDLNHIGFHYPQLHFVQPTRPAVADLSILLDDVEGASGVRPQRVFIDHLSLMADCYSGYEAHTRTASELHAWAMRENVALYVLQQTGRGGQDGRNDGHQPVTLSSGLYAGEADADWVFGLYRPERNPKFFKKRWEFKSDDEYIEVRQQYEEVRGIVMFQVVKNRPYGEVLEQGIELLYDARSRRYREVGIDGSFDNGRKPYRD